MVALFGRGSWAEVSRIADDPAQRDRRRCAAAGRPPCSRWSGRTRRGRTAYDAFQDSAIGPAALHLDLTAGASGPPTGCWRSSSSSPAWSSNASSSPVTCGTPAAPCCRSRPRVGGMVAPALRVHRCQPAAPARREGWAIPTATDIAFALAVLAVIGTAPAVRAADVPAHPGRRRRPAGDHHHRALLHRRPARRCRCCSPLVPLAVFTVLVQRRVRSWWLLLPLAFATWALVHASGVHATVAGVLLGFRRPGAAQQVDGGPDAGPGLAEHFEHRFRPISAGVRRPGVRVLRRRCHASAAPRAGHRADRPDRGRHRRRPGHRQTHRRARRHLPGRPRFTRAQLRRDLRWSTSPGCRRPRRVSGSPCPC